MPFVYYVFDYVTGVYTALLYSGIESVVEFLGFMICIFYILFIFLYFREYEEKTEAEETKVYSGGELSEAVVVAERPPSLWERIKKGVMWGVAAIILAAAGWIIYKLKK